MRDSWLYAALSSAQGAPRLFALNGGTDPTTVGGTFSRASTATYLDASGVVQTASSGVPRYQHYDPSNPTLGPLLLLEGSRTNKALWSRDVTNVAWTKTGCSAALNATGIDGTANSATTLTESAGGTFHNINPAVAVVTDAVANACAFWAKPNGRTWVWMQIGANAAYFNLSGAGSIGTNTLTAARITKIGNWYYCRGVFTPAGSTVWNVGLATGDGGANYSGDGTSGVIIDGLQCESSASFESSTIFTTTTAVTRAADSLSFPFVAGPQAMTVYADGINLGSGLVTAGLWEISSAASATPYLATYANGVNNFTAEHNTGTPVQSVRSYTPTYGERTEWRSLTYGDGSVQLGTSIASAAEVVATQSAGKTFAAAWSDTKLWVNSTGSTNTGYVAFRALKIAAGVQSLATMRGL